MVDLVRTFWRRPVTEAAMLRIARASTGGLALLRGGPSALGPRAARLERRPDDARSPSFVE